MFKNSVKWREEEAPETLRSLINEVEESEGLEEPDGTGIYIQRAKNTDSGNKQIRIGYYLPEMARKFNTEEQFRQELFISVRRNGDEPVISVLYHSDVLDIFSTSENFDQKLVEIDDEKLAGLSDDLKEHGFLERSDLDEYMAAI